MRRSSPIHVRPGYVAGWALDLFEFRQRRPILRLILAVHFPSPSVRCFVSAGTICGAGALGVLSRCVRACILLLAKEARRAKRRGCKIYLGRVGTGGGVGSGSHRIDGRSSNRRQLYPPIVAYDHSVRTAMTVALRAASRQVILFLLMRRRAALSLFVVVVLQPAHEGAPFTAAIRRVFRSRLVRPGPDVHDRAWPQVPVGSTGRHRKENSARVACSV